VSFYKACTGKNSEKKSVLFSILRENDRFFQNFLTILASGGVLDVKHFADGVNYEIYTVRLNIQTAASA